MNKLNTGLTVTLVVTILLTIFLWVAVGTDAKIVEGYNGLGWAYLYIYFLLPLIVLLFLILSVSYAVKSGLKGLSNLKWNFLLVTVFVIMVSSIAPLNKALGFSKKVVILLSNRAESPIEVLRIYGRHDLVEARDLASEQNAFIEFRGVNIDYETKNHFENRLQVDYYSNKKWKTKRLLWEWTVMTWDTLKIEFHEMDSVATYVY